LLLVVVCVFEAISGDEEADDDAEDEAEEEEDEDEGVAMAVSGRAICE
jgi:hypothetical protein